MSWTPVNEAAQRDAEMTTVKAIVDARTSLRTTSASRLGLPGIPELSQQRDGPFMPNGSC